LKTFPRDAHAAAIDETGPRRFEVAFADVAEWADEIGPDIDLNGVHGHCHGSFTSFAKDRTGKEVKEMEITYKRAK